MSPGSILLKLVVVARKIARANWFQNAITSTIVFSGIVIGLATHETWVAKWGYWFDLMQSGVLVLFIVELVIKLTARWPRPLSYFQDPWNVFDFTIICLSLAPIGGNLALLGRLARLLRVLRLISAVPELRLLVTTLLRSIPSIGNVLVLMLIIFYIYAVIGFHLFHKIDPTHWHNLGISLLTLFRVVTLEDWTDVMYAAMEVDPWAWVFFVSFVVLCTFIVINLFIAVLLNNLDQAKEQHRLEQLAIAEEEAEEEAKRKDAEWREQYGLTEQEVIVRDAEQREREAASAHEALMDELRHTRELVEQLQQSLEKRNT